MTSPNETNYSQMVLSIYLNAKNSSRGTTCTLDAVVNLIRNGNNGLIAKTEKCRQLAQADKKAYRKYKESALPAVTFSGQFDVREADKLKTHSGLLTIDFDDCDVVDVMSQVSEITSCVLAFVSPSGKGVKAVFAIDFIPKNDTEHKYAFKDVSVKIEHIAKIDPSGKDVSRLCFLSYYRQVHYNPTPQTYFTWTSDNKTTEQKTLKLDDIDLSVLDYIHPDSNYDNWIHVGMAIKNQGLDFSVFDNWSKRGEKYNADEMPHKWNSFKRDGITWATVVALAKEKGYEPKPKTTHKTIVNDIKVKEKKEPSQFEYPHLPDDVFYGGFNDLYDAYIGKGSYVLDKPFILAMGLSAVGIISARKRYIKAYDESDVVLFPNMYSLVVGTSTYASKSTTREHLVRLVENVYADTSFECEINFLTSVSTKQSLLAELETPNDTSYFDGVCALLHFDELKAMFDNMRRDYASDIQSLLNTLWSCPVRQQNRALSNKIDALYPVMNIFGCSTREWLNAALIKDDLDGGFMNRFMTFYSDGLENYVSKPRIHTKSYDTFLQKLTMLLDEPINKSGGRRAQGYILSDEAFATWDNYCKEAYESGRKQNDNIGTRRSSLHALKIALALHIITDIDEYKIGFKCIDTALAITEYLEQVGTHIYANIVSDQSAKIEQRILSLLNRKNNSLSRRSILQSLRDAGYREVGNVIDGLIRENVLFLNTDNGNIEVLK